MSRRTWIRRLRRDYAKACGVPQRSVSMRWHPTKAERGNRANGGYFVANGRALGGWGAEIHEAGAVALGELHGDNAVNRYWVGLAIRGNDAELERGDSLASRAKALASGVPLRLAMNRYPLRVGTRWLV